MKKTAFIYSFSIMILLCACTQADAQEISEYGEILSVIASDTITGAVDISYNILQDPSVYFRITVERSFDPASIPTLSQYGTILFALLLVVYGLLRIPNGKPVAMVLIIFSSLTFSGFSTAVTVNSDWVTLTSAIPRDATGAGVYRDYPPLAGGYLYRLNVFPRNVYELYTESLPVTVASTSGSWSTTGDLNYSGMEDRYLETATMSDGKFLVMRKSPLIAEVYDTDTGTWTAKTPYTTAKNFNYACKLAGTDKIILPVFSNDSSGARSQDTTTLIYDYSTDTWSETGAFIKPRILANIDCLPNGKALLTGGELYDDYVTNTNYYSTNSVEIYDPATEQWSLATSMNNGRAYHASILLNDGRLLVIGGRYHGSAQEEPVSEHTAEIYDPDTDSWTATGNLNEGRRLEEAILLDDGKVLVAGGFKRNTGWLNSAEIYDPSTDSWTTTGSMSDRKTGFTFVKMADGNVMAVGGRYQDWEFEFNTTLNEWVTTIYAMFILRTLDIYDPTAGTWTETTNMFETREFPLAHKLSDGSILIGGGWDSFDTKFTSAMIYTP